MHTAPADSTCSNSGILGLGFTLDTTATTSGAWAKRLRSVSIFSGAASGLSVLEGRGLDLAETVTALAPDEDEAPRGQPAVVRHAGGDRQERLDLVRGRARLAEPSRRHRAAGLQARDTILHGSFIQWAIM